ncbi:MAG: hypothetical protein F6K62_25570 [Sphaerospermopsis sp. SIO1G2]|nr:hypothetical protein [Sphaerospermopsis sp. SIO1G2]
MLSSIRPFLIIEYGTNTWPAFGATVKDLFHILEKHKYFVMRFSPTENKITAITDDIWNSPYTNLVLVPEEKSDSI